MQTAGNWYSVVTVPNGTSFVSVFDKDEQTDRLM